MGWRRRFFVHAAVPFVSLTFVAHTCGPFAHMSVVRSMKIIPPASTKNPKAAPTHAKPHTHGVLMKQWEKKIMYASTEASTPSSSSSLLDNRVFFASKLSYPCAVFSTIKYEPKKEEAMRRRRKVLEGGGGGRLYFATEGRDWRGTSYRAIVGSLKMRLQVSKASKRRRQDEDDEAKPKQRQKRANLPPSRIYLPPCSHTCMPPPPCPVFTQIC